MKKGIIRTVVVIGYENEYKHVVERHNGYLTEYENLCLGVYKDTRHCSWTLVELTTGMIISRKKLKKELFPLDTELLEKVKERLVTNDIRIQTCKRLISEDKEDEKK